MGTVGSKDTVGGHRAIVDQLVKGAGCRPPSRNKVDPRRTLPILIFPTPTSQHQHPNPRRFFFRSHSLLSPPIASDQTSKSGKLKEKNDYIVILYHPSNVSINRPTPWPTTTTTTTWISVSFLEFPDISDFRGLIEVFTDFPFFLDF